LVAVETGADLADVAVAVRVTVAPAEPAKLSPEDQDVLLTYLQDQVAKAIRTGRRPSWRPSVAPTVTR